MNHPNEVDLTDALTAAGYLALAGSLSPAHFAAVQTQLARQLRYKEAVA